MKRAIQITIGLAALYLCRLRQKRRSRSFIPQKDRARRSRVRMTGSVMRGRSKTPGSILRQSHRRRRRNRPVRPSEAGKGRGGRFAARPEARPSVRSRGMQARARELARSPVQWWAAGRRDSSATRVINRPLHNSRTLSILFTVASARAWKAVVTRSSEGAAK